MRISLSLQNKMSQAFEEILKFTDGTIVQKTIGTVVYEYKYDNHKLTCISHANSYPCDYIILGQLLAGDDSVKVIIDVDLDYNVVMSKFGGSI